MTETVLEQLVEANAQTAVAANRVQYMREEIDRLVTLASDLQGRLSQLEADAKRWSDAVGDGGQT